MRKVIHYNPQILLVNSMVLEMLSHHQQFYPLELEWCLLLRNKYWPLEAIYCR